jgi:hypothetical protein
MSTFTCHDQDSIAVFILHEFWDPHTESHAHHTIWVTSNNLWAPSYLLYNLYQIMDKFQLTVTNILQCAYSLKVNNIHVEIFIRRNFSLISPSALNGEIFITQKVCPVIIIHRGYGDLYCIDENSFCRWCWHTNSLLVISWLDNLSWLSLIPPFLTNPYHCYTAGTYARI